MHAVRGLAAALIAAMAMVWVDRASAEDGRGAGTAAHYLLFAGTDLWRQGGFSYGGLLWSPGGLDNEGFTFKLLLGGGLYQYRSGALGDVDVTGRQLTAFALPGWRFKRDGFELTVFGGLDVQDHRLTPDDPSSKLRGRFVGTRIGADFWYEPTPTTMIAADASGSSIGRSYSARGAFGWRAFDCLYVGPEIAALGSDNYRQLRAGLHVTGLHTAAFEWSAGLGWLTDSDDRHGAYARLGVLTRR